MDDQNQEDLTKLFEKFFDAAQAAARLEDVRKGEQILREHPAPKPDALLIANIKAEIGVRLPARKEGLSKRVVYHVAAAAAAIVILATMATKFLDRGGEPGPLVTAGLIPTAIWESNDIAADDESLAILTAEIEQIENEVLTLQSGEDTGDSDSTITELEMELIEISSDFWKG